MKFTTFPKIFFTTLILLTLLYSCGKDDDSSTQVCCGSEIATDADFGFFHRGSGFDSIYWMEYKLNDTFYNWEGSNTTKLYFRAKSPQMDNYSWKVGLDPNIFTDSLFFLSFSNINGSIDVTLDVTLDVNQECFPNDSGLESKTKSLNLKTFSSASLIPIYGMYEGYVEDNPNEVFTIEMNDLSNEIYNFPNGCDNLSNFVFLVMAAREFRFDEKINLPCGKPSGGGWLEEGNQTLIIEYFIDDENNPSERIFKRFIGQRIP